MVLACTSPGASLVTLVRVDAALTRLTVSACHGSWGAALVGFWVAALVGSWVAALLSKKRKRWRGGGGSPCWSIRVQPAFSPPPGVLGKGTPATPRVAYSRSPGGHVAMSCRGPCRRHTPRMDARVTELVDGLLRLPAGRDRPVETRKRQVSAAPAALPAGLTSPLTC